MRKRMVVPVLLTCVAISATGCWMERDACGKLRIYGPREFRARESYLKETEPERFAQMSSRRDAGAGWMVLGGVGIAAGVATYVYSEDGNEETAGGLVGSGIFAILIGQMLMDIGQCQYEHYVRKAGRRRAQLQVAPNGCLLTCRF